MADTQNGADFVLGLLAERLVEARERAEKERPETHTGGVVFLLGAGCSMQYGLPGFADLLRLAHRDLIGRPAQKREGLSTLREKLDPYWRVRQDSELRALLRSYLMPISGRDCAGYRRLAWLMHQGYVRHVINMNFDLLLEEALEHEAPHDAPVPPYWVRKLIDKKSDRPTVYKLHGSLRPKDGSPTLDIVKSDLFKEREVETRTQDLLRNNHVVLIGYTGGDAKIAHALEPTGTSPADGSTDPSATAEPPEGQPNQVFVANVGRPSPHLLAIMEKRASQELSIVGEEGAFENVMEILQAKVRQKQQDQEHETAGKPVRVFPFRERNPKIRRSAHFTYSESEALDRCRRLAIGIRSTMAIAETSPSTIEEHAEDLFQCCLDLAAASQAALTPPEKYLLHCAAYLHDLGYFSAYDRLYSGQESGWSFLNGHGQETAELLRKYLLDPPEKLSGAGRSLVPETYFTPLSGRSSETADDDRLRFVQHLIRLCRRHSRPDLDDREAAEDGRDSRIEIRGCPVIVRPRLVEALFITAEEISEGHPFLPSPYPLELVFDDREADDCQEERSLQADEDTIEDPILDLYLRLKPKEVSYEIQPGRILATLDRKRKATTLSKSAIWLWSVAIQAVNNLSRAVKESHADYWREVTTSGTEKRPRAKPADGDPGAPSHVKGMLFTYVAPQDMPDLEHREEHEIVRDAMEERFAALVDKQSRPESQGATASLLDLMAIFTIPKSTKPILGTPEAGGDRYDGEVLLDEHCAPVRKALEEVRQACTKVEGRIPAEGLLYHYFMALAEGRREGLLDRRLIESFETIYYPAWRFLAAHWRSEVDAVVMARAAMEYGSSRYRDEVIGGIRHLIEDKVEWKKEKEKDDDSRLRAHDGCTICGSRLIYVFAAVRRLMPDKELRNRLTDAQDHSGDQVARGLLYNFIQRGPNDESWWGLEEDPNDTSPDGGKSRPGHVHAADYLAWAARATAFAIAVDEEVRESAAGHGAPGWFEEMELDRSAVHRLFRQRWQALLETKMKHLLHEKAEEPHSYIVGEVATTLLTVERLSRYVEPLKAVVDLADLGGIVEEIRIAVDALEQTAKKQTGHEEFGLSQLSRFFLWPAKIFLERFGPHEDEHRRLKQRLGLVKTFEECLNSKVWIRSPGSGRGSWGYNLENTQRLNSALATFWRRVLEDREAFAPIFEEVFSRGEGGRGEQDGGATKAARARAPKRRTGSAKKRPAKRPKKS